MASLIDLFTDPNMPITESLDMDTASHVRNRRAMLEAIMAESGDLVAVKVFRRVTTEPVSGLQSEHLEFAYCLSLAIDQFYKMQRQHATRLTYMSKALWRQVICRKHPRSALSLPAAAEKVSFLPYANRSPEDAHPC